MSASVRPYYWLLGLSMMFTHSILGQTYVLLNNETLLPFEKSLNKPGLNFHPGIKPYDNNEISQLIDIDSVFSSKNHFPNLFRVNKEKRSSIEILPLITGTFAYGKDTSTLALGNGSCGALLNANFDRLGISAYYQSGVSKFPRYINDQLRVTNIAPGNGYAHQTNYNTINYRNFGGYISYSPAKLFNFTLGHGKNFFGNGYRSMLLSDVANNYTYFRINTTIGKFKYVQLYSNFKDISSSTYSDYFSMPNKFGAFHYLSWNIAPWLNASFFETVIWPGKDDNLQRGFDISYLNPVSFYRPIEYSIGSSDNSLMGLNLSVNAGFNHMLYGQIMLDEFLLSQVRTTITHHWLRRQTTEWGWWANKQAIQIGYRWFDAFFAKNLNWRIEYNYVPPYTYSHTGGLLNYGHENQPLAHVLGANFHEIISILNFQRGHWYVELKNMYQVVGKDTGSSNYGSNIYLDYQTYENLYQNYAGQGITSEIFFNQLKVSYIILPASNLSIQFGVLNRVESNANFSYSTNYIFGGLSTSLSNLYRDF